MCCQEGVKFDGRIRPLFGEIYLQESSGISGDSIYCRLFWDVRVNASNMTQEQIRKQIEVLYAVAATHKTPEDSRQFLIEAGIIRRSRL